MSRLTLAEVYERHREKWGETGIASELYRAVIAGEAEFPSRTLSGGKK